MFMLRPYRTFQEFASAAMAIFRSSVHKQHTRELFFTNSLYKVIINHGRYCMLYNDVCLYLGQEENIHACRDSVKGIRDNNYMIKMHMRH